MIRGAILAERLDRAALARGYLRELIDSQPAPELLQSLRREYGIGTFLKLSARTSLQPASEELLTLINEASRQAPPTAADVESFISELGLSADQTFRAGTKILAAEDTAVVPLLAADQATPEGKLAANLLEQHARRFRRGLVAALAGSDDTMKPRILQLIGKTAAPFFATDLLRYRFSNSPDIATAATNATSMLLLSRPAINSKQDAVTTLLDQSLDLVKRANTPFPNDQDRLAELSLARELDPSADLSVYGTMFLKRAVSLAEDAVAISPENQTAAAIMQTCTLAVQSWPARWPENFQRPSFGADPDQRPAPAAVAALSIALDTENSAAILQLLAQSDSSIPLIVHDRKLLHRCRLSPDPRVRLMTAALENAVKKSSPYTRATVASVLTGGRTKEAVVIDTRSGESAGSAAVIVDQEYVTATANSGKRGFDDAAGQLRCELILVHSNCLQWTMPHTIANLRADYRTRNTPIIIYGPEIDELRTETTQSAYPGIWFMPEPISEYTFADTYRLTGVTQPLLTDQERAAMIRLARQIR